MMHDPVQSMRLKIDFAQASDPGRDPNKQVNEDACGYAETRLGHLMVLCDGMGGHYGGKEASTTAIATIFEVFAEAQPSALPAAILKAAIEEAGRRVYLLGGPPDNRARPGSTIVAMLLHDRGVDVAHVGDSRAYVIRGSQIYPLTRDHSMVQGMIDAGMLTEEQAMGHPDANKITRALGMRPEVDVEVRPEPMELFTGDVLLQSSDGLTDLALGADILGVTQQALAQGPLANACSTLVQLANHRGGHDNITVQMARVVEVGQKAQTTIPGIPQGGLAAHSPPQETVQMTVSELTPTPLAPQAMNPAMSAPAPTRPPVSAPTQKPAPGTLAAALPAPPPLAAAPLAAPLQAAPPHASPPQAAPPHASPPLAAAPLAPPPQAAPPNASPPHASPPQAVPLQGALASPQPGLAPAPALASPPLAPSPPGASLQGGPPPPPATSASAPRQAVPPGEPSMGLVTPGARLSSAGPAPGGTTDQRAPLAPVPPLAPTAPDGTPQAPPAYGLHGTQVMAKPLRAQTGGFAAVALPLAAPQPAPAPAPGPTVNEHGHAPAPGAPHMQPAWSMNPYGSPPVAPTMSAPLPPPALQPHGAGSYSDNSLPLPPPSVMPPGGSPPSPTHVSHAAGVSPLAPTPVAPTPLAPTPVSASIAPRPAQSGIVFVIIGMSTVIAILVVVLIWALWMR